MKGRRVSANSTITNIGWGIPREDANMRPELPNNDTASADLELSMAT